MKRLLLGCGKVLLVCLLLVCVCVGWTFHVHKRMFPLAPPRSSIDETAWKQAAVAPAKPETKLKVLTWNIQMLPTFLAPFSKDLQKLQHVRAPWIVDYLNGQDYDVICFQEAFDQKALAILEKGLRQKYPYMVFPQYASP